MYFNMRPVMCWKYSGSSLLRGLPSLWHLVASHSLQTESLLRPIDSGDSIYTYKYVFVKWCMQLFPH